MRVLVIDALTLGTGQRHFTRDFIGAGPRMVASTLRHCNQDVSLIRGEDFLENSSIHSKNHDICFISAMSMDKTSVLNIARKWKKKNDNRGNFVLVGGPIASGYEIFIRDPNIDFAVIGEGEKILQELFQDEKGFTSKESLPLDGLVSETNFKSINVQDLLTRYRPGIPLIEKINPGIDLLKSYKNDWAARIYIECMRGCSNFTRAKINANSEYICKDCGYCDPGNDLKVDDPCVAGIKPGCGFCSTPAVFGPVRSFSEKHVVEQVKDAVGAGCHRIVLGGSDFLEYKREDLFEEGYTRPKIPPKPNYEAIQGLISSITSIKEVQDGVVQIFIENVKAGLCDEESFEIISNIPNISLTIGVETGCEEHLNLIGKSTTMDDIKNAVHLANKHDVRYSAYFVHSLPGQTKETVGKSLSLMKWLHENDVEKITIYRFKPLPMTAFENYKPSKKTLGESSSIVKLARQINSSKKTKYIGNTYDVLIAEEDYRQEGDAIGYMLGGGPKVKIKGGKQHVNDRKIHLVKVTAAISDKIIEGEIIS
ncbi:MAG: B12-binding domain-containing radical SAM protein [Candidatus Hodarchaeota archaeon]